MKKYILLIIAFISLSGFGYSQSYSMKSFRADDLIGTWIPIYNKDNNGYLIFVKKTDTKRRYGSSVEFQKNGAFYNKYSAPCGNDTMLRTHNYNGKWKLDEKDWTISTTKPINGNGNLFKIVSLQSNKLIIEEIKVQ